VPTYIRPKAQFKLVAFGTPIVSVGQREVEPVFDNFAVSVPFMRVGHFYDVDALTRLTDQRRLFEIGGRDG
jgi:hypothetical protein